MHYLWAKQKGFTIVELLIVIVVIGILAAITIVAYNGIQQRAIVASLSSDLDNASKQLKLYQIDNGTYPTSNDCSASPATGSICLKASSGNSYTSLQTGGTSGAPTFCLPAKNGSNNYRITDDSAPTAGTCDGVLTNGLVAYYPFTGNANDASGNGKHGTVNGATLTTGIAGQAYAFDGVSNYINCGDFGTFYNQGTISFWMNATVVENYRNAFTTKYNGDNDAIRFEEYTTPTPFGGFNGSIVTTSHQYSPSAALSPGVWYHVALVWNKDTNNVVGYLNNVLQFNESNTTWPTTMPSVAIGNGYSSARFWKGSIDEVRIYNRALSAGEVTALYNL